MPNCKTGWLGHWPLNEGTGTIAGDASGNGNTGDLLNGPIWSSQLTLSWNDNSNNKDNFAIERKTGTTETYSQITLTTANTVSFVDTNVTHGVSYCYRLRAINTAGPQVIPTKRAKLLPKSLRQGNPTLPIQAVQNLDKNVSIIRSRGFAP